MKPKPPSTTFRPSADVQAMLGRVRRENRVVSRVINEVLLQGLKARGYARKRELAN